ncbi:hypothetical protein CSUB01_05965 [Colletotrichum sublineola]|uniref:Uncharacterized protein n=1 Tax=Colletotrichum sublineola TaxID=1173701 RepID=A0A066WV68_COLSU|nr:hypothetical protein CSUB01_05965 [Colletotrichum sublineola]
MEEQLLGMYFIGQLPCAPHPAFNPSQFLPSNTTSTGLLMASTTFSVDFANESLRGNGFFRLENQEIGDDIVEFQSKGFPFRSDIGLEFLRKHVLENAPIRSTIESVFDHCTLGHVLRYQAYPGKVVFFQKGPQAGLHGLTVQMWCKGSRAKHYAGSHRLDLPLEKGDRSLLEAQPTVLAEQKCEGTEKQNEAGSVVISDARVGFEIQEGYVIVFMFAMDNLVSTWVPMDLPDSRKLKDKVNAMKTDKIGLNFVFVETQTNQAASVASCSSLT